MYQLMSKYCVSADEQAYLDTRKQAAGLNLTYFTTRSNLIPNAFIWENLNVHFS